MATHTAERRPATVAQTPSARPAPAAMTRSRFAMPRSRGAVSGLVLVILGVWGAVIPFVGPYFGYEFGSGQAWVISWDRVWLDVLPGATLVLGGLILLAARNRLLGALGGCLALAGGIWFVAGPAIALLWDGARGINPIGVPVGSNDLQVLELLGYFYALGAAAIAISAFALGRLSVVGVRDLEATATPRVATDGARADPERVDGTASTDQAEPAPVTRETTHDDGATTAPRRRLFRRS